MAGRKIINDANADSFANQSLNNVRTYKTGSAGNEKFSVHGFGALGGRLKTKPLLDPLTFCRSGQEADYWPQKSKNAGSKLNRTMAFTNIRITDKCPAKGHGGKAVQVYCLRPKARLSETM
jgi:hypothetical protein